MISGCIFIFSSISRTLGAITSLANLATLSLSRISSSVNVDRDVRTGD